SSVRGFEHKASTEVEAKLESIHITHIDRLDFADVFATLTKYYFIVQWRKTVFCKFIRIDLSSASKPIAEKWTCTCIPFELSCAAEFSAEVYVVEHRDLYIIVCDSILKHFVDTTAVHFAFCGENVLSVKEVALFHFERKHKAGVVTEEWIDFQLVSEGFVIDGHPGHLRSSLYPGMHDLSLCMKRDNACNETKKNIFSHGHKMLLPASLHTFCCISFHCAKRMRLQSAKQSYLWQTACNNYLYLETMVSTDTYKHRSKGNALHH